MLGQRLPFNIVSRAQVRVEIRDIQQMFVDGAWGKTILNQTIVKAIQKLVQWTASEFIECWWNFSLC